MTLLRPRAVVMCALALIAIALFGVARCTRAGTSSVPQVAPPAALASGPTLRTIAQENALPGSAGWAITRPALDGQIAAYTGEASAQRGETLDVYVSTKGAASYRADIYRMGWYGGAGARLVQTLRHLDGDDQGRWDPLRGLTDCRTCTLDPSTLLLDTHWRESFGLGIAADWVSGYYLIKFEEAATGTQTYAIFVVRDDASRSAALVQASTNTWQAYNTWGDASLYGSFGANRVYVAKKRRAYRVSYDRPYDMRITNSTKASTISSGDIFWSFCQTGIYRSAPITKR